MRLGLLLLVLFLGCLENLGDRWGAQFLDTGADSKGGPRPGVGLQDCGDADHPSVDYHEGAPNLMRTNPVHLIPPTRLGGEVCPFYR